MVPVSSTGLTRAGGVAVSDTDEFLMTVITVD
jgi:hypothetical protein